MNKIDFIGLIECRNANPNGNIDEDNRPRQNDDGYGYMTDVCIKRRIKDCAKILKADDPRYKLYIENDRIPLETKTNKFIEENGTYEKIKEMSTEEKFEMVKNGFKTEYFDIRAFGGVISSFTKDKYLDGQMRGCVQISFAQSLDTISPEQLTISRVSVQTEKDAEEKSSELGKKWIVPYGVYMFEGHINPFVADKNGFTEKDKEVLFESILKMYEYNQSASSTGISVLKLFIFEHENQLGKCNFRKIMDTLKIQRNDMENSYISCPYNISVDAALLPDGINVTCME